ncbi:MAG TPA: serine/threonine-protein kinase [Gemmataceae bacterium]|nr:serine/threonine-protein kinase [Gemmataceae bacterium]
MPAPFSPDPPDPSTVPLPAAKAPSTQTHPNPTPDPEAQTPVAQPTPSSFEPPTVISGLRTRTGPFDPKIGDTLAGRKLGHFELIEAVGAGGMAAVLKARDLDLGRIVALKILPPDMAAEPENIVRFKQEARAAARLDHENVARVYFFGEDQGLHFIAFEFVEGDNLRQLMNANGGTIPIPDGVTLMLQVAAGLAHAAERGVVHRDIKPSNIIVTPDGRAKIVDMGLARNLDPKAGQLTESGVTLGTFDYISPEQAIEPRMADVRSDIYSLGCTFYHALTGHIAVPDGNAAKKLDAQKHILPPDPRVYNPAIPADLAAVLGRMMAKDPDRRYQHPDHLCAHLRSVARQLGVPLGPLPTVGPAFEDPLPKPPRLSAAWGLAAVAIIALFAVVMTNAFRPTPDTSFPEVKGPGPVLVDPTDPLPGGPGAVAVTGRRDAANKEELVALLKEGARNIRLTGPEYDLVNYRDRDGHPVDALLTGDDVKLEGTNDETPPTVRLGFAPDGKARSKTLTIRGPANGKGTATIRGIRFQLPNLEDDSDQANLVRHGPDEAGLVVSGFDRVTFEECTFVSASRAPRDGPAALAIFLRSGLASLAKCYFAPGSVGVLVDGPGRLTATECALGPHHAGVRVIRSNAELVGENEIRLTHCSALMSTGGSLIEVGDKVPCSMRAAYCLFGGPDRSAMDESPVIVRQRRERAAQTKYEGDPETAPNGYHNVAAYAEGDMSYSFAEAARDKLPIKDVDKQLKHPWDDRDPFALLADKPPDPRKAFKPNLGLADLRIKGDRTAVLGSRFLGPSLLYSGLATADTEPRDPTVKVLDPSLPETAEDKDLPPGVYPTLARALAAVGRSGTLLIRHSGKLEVDPFEFTKSRTNITIKPDGNSRPILVPAPAALKRTDGLFKLFAKQSEGRLVLDGLHFRLPAGRAPAVAVLPGGGQLEIRNCVITMEEGEDLAAVVLTDPRGEMMMMGTTGPAEWPLPKVTFENVLIRGKGRLLAVKGSRPFELDVKNALAALDSTLIDIDPSTADPSNAGSGIIRMSRVTAYLGGSLLHFRASDKKTDMGTTGLAKTEITANNCVFAPAGSMADPLVRADRLDSKEQVDKWFVWRGKENVYGYDKKKVVLEIRPADQDVMPLKMIEGDRWLEMSLEEGDPFAEVGFAFKQPEAGQTKKFLGIRPKDFQQLRLDPPRPEGAAAVGTPEDVPAPFPEE